jgi:organic hydroperoxide reductase OsmC/OhrA
MNPQNPPTVRFKRFEFDTSVTWHEGKSGSAQAEGRPVLEVASPPEFKGAPDRWSPEHLFVAAVDVCQMTTFLALASRSGIALRSYRSSGKGILESDGTGFRFTRVILTPHIVVGAGANREQIAAMVEEAHRQCLIARSLQAAVDIQPTITTE